jgi:hypothetical protein
MSNVVKQLNPGPLCAARGGELISFAFRINGVANPDFLWQCAAGAVESVVIVAAGRYTVQFAKAYPRQIVHIVCQLAQATANDTIEGVRYKQDSYDPSTGTLELQTITDDGDGTLTVETVTDNTVVYVSMFVQRVEALVEDES